MAAFSVAAAWIIVSATRHSNAEAKCIQDFFSSTGPGSDSSEGEALCNIFAWVDVGVMGALWILLAILQVSHFIRRFFNLFLSAAQLYLFVILSSYGIVQRRDPGQYDRLYDPSQPLTAENIPLDHPTDPWDSRPSVDPYGVQDARYYDRHERTMSTMSASDLMNNPPQKPEDDFSHYNPYGQAYGYTYNAKGSPIGTL